MATEQTQNTEETLDKEIANGPEFSICPCCGKPTLPASPDINPAVMDRFMACMMTGVEFSNTYSLYGGKVTVCIEQLSPKDANVMVDAVSKLTSIESMPCLKDAQVSAGGIRSAIRTLCGIRDIQFSVGGAVRTFHPKSLVLEHCRTLCAMETADKTVLAPEQIETLRNISAALSSPDNISGLTVKQLITIVETHNRIYDILLDKGFDKNFWEGIKLA